MIRQGQWVEETDSANMANKANKAKADEADEAIVAVRNAPVDERICCWNVLKKWYKEVECVAIKMTKLSILCYNSICSMYGRWWHISPPLPLSYPEKENRQTQGRN